MGRDIQSKYSIELIDNSEHLIMISYFMNQEISNIDCGKVDEILYKVKMYDEEFKNLFTQNQKMKKIQKQLDKNSQQEKENLINYLEEFVSKTDYEINILGNYPYLAWSNAYKDLLEKVRSGKYE